MSTRIFSISVGLHQGLNEVVINHFLTTEANQYQSAVNLAANASDHVSVMLSEKAQITTSKN